MVQDQYILYVYPFEHQQTHNASAALWRGLDKGLQLSFNYTYERHSTKSDSKKLHLKDLLHGKARAATEQYLPLE